MLLLSHPGARTSVGDSVEVHVLGPQPTRRSESACKPSLWSVPTASLVGKQSDPGAGGCALEKGQWELGEPLRNQRSHLGLQGRWELARQGGRPGEGWPREGQRERWSGTWDRDALGTTAR